MQKIKAAVLDELKGSLKIQELDLAEPSANEIMVKLVSTGICTTDIGMMNGHGAKVNLPIVPGHEGAGVVVKVGEGVTDFKEGDHVALSSLFCGTCKMCRSGKQLFCDRYAYFLTCGRNMKGDYVLFRDGEPINNYFSQSSFSTYVTVHVNSAVKLPEDFDLKLAGPIGCGLRTGAGSVYSYLRPRPGEFVLLNGAGSLGFGALWMAKAMGAKTIMCDLNDSRLQIARETGCDFTINAGREDAYAKIMEYTNGVGVDFMFEATGSEKAYKTGIKALRSGGLCAEAAVIGKISFDNYYLEFNTKTVHQIRMGDTNHDVIMPMICKLYLEGKFPMDRISTFYKFEEIGQAIEDCRSGAVIKPIILFD